MKRNVITAARLTDEAIKRGGFRSRAAMLTLTYRNTSDWQPKHISSLINHLRMYLHNRHGQKLRCVWVAELQQRGAVHYHVIVWLPKGITCPKPDKQGWWPHGMTQWQWARNAVGYIAKYTSKGHHETGKPFPKGLRLHASSGLDAAQRMERRWWLLPRYARIRFPSWQHDIRRALGGGFLNKATGEVTSPVFYVLGRSKRGPRLLYDPGADWQGILFLCRTELSLDQVPAMLDMPPIIGWTPETSPEICLNFETASFSAPTDGNLSQK